MSYPNGECFKPPHSALLRFILSCAFGMRPLTLCHSGFFDCVWSVALNNPGNKYTLLAMFSSLQILEDKILLASHPSIAARKCHQDTESFPRVLDKSYTRPHFDPFAMTEEHTTIVHNELSKGLLASMAIIAGSTSAAVARLLRSSPTII